MASSRDRGASTPSTRCSAQVFPVLQVLALIIFVIPWFIYCLFLASSGEMETVKGARQMVYDETTFKAGWRDAVHKSHCRAPRVV